MLDSGRRPTLAAVAQVEIREDERREEDAVAYQEQQETLQSQLANVGIELIGMAVVRDRSDGH
jgi:hypothetical protein